MNDPFTVDVQVRYQDLDTLEHVNNAVYVSYFEHARTEYLAARLDLDVAEYEFVVANLEINYEASITYGQSVRVATETTAVGTTSWTMAYEIRADGEVAATGQSTQVCLDPETGSPVEVPDSMRERLRSRDG